MEDFGRFVLLALTKSGLAKRIRRVLELGPAGSFWAFGLGVFAGLLGKDYFPAAV
ncbi:MAG: hypothetical protein ABSA66_21685 [Roseiarcus sp.]